MDNVKMNIWNRPFQLKVIFECYGEQVPASEQKTRLEAFIENDEGINSALEEVKKYCLEDEKMVDDGNNFNVFKYVIPTSIYVKRKEKQGIVALLCDYKFDIEHGIAIVFEKGDFVKIVSQGDI